jgi:hypothetical protein
LNGLAVFAHKHALALAHASGGGKCKGSGYRPPAAQRMARCYRVIFRRQIMGTPLARARGRAPLSVLSTCVTKQTGDMVYSEARR